MAGPVAADALWQSVEPGRVEPQLAELWKQVARHGPVSRAYMSNLVVVRPREAAADVDADDPEADVIEVARRHPARTIVLNYIQRTGETASPHSARVGVLTFGSTQRYGVEVIAVGARCADASIPSIVRRLTRGSVPTTIWWLGDVSAASPPGSLVACGRQLLYDSAHWRHVGSGARAIAAALEQPFAPDIADLNWRRLAPLRAAIAHAVQMDHGPRAIAADEVRIQYRPGSAAAAWLLAGWFACRLKWNSERPRVSETREGHDQLRVSIGSGASAIDAAINMQRVKVKHPSAATFRMPVPRESTVDAVVAELRSLGRDHCLADAIRELAAMAE